MPAFAFLRSAVATPIMRAAIFGGRRRPRVYASAGCSARPFDELGRQDHRRAGRVVLGGAEAARRAGVIVIESIASGLSPLDLSSSLRYMITGGVLAIAVIVDSLARRSRVSHDRA